MVKKTIEVEFDVEERKMIEILTEGACSIKNLSRSLDKSAAYVFKLAQKLVDKGVFIIKYKDTLRLGGEDVESESEDMELHSRELKVGFLSDTMLGNKSEQPTNLCKAFQIAEKEGVNLMIHLGVSGGKPIPTKREEFHKATITEQIDYIVKNYPRSSKFKTRLISGYHDMQWRKDKRNILAEVCMRREDLFYGGDWQSNFRLRRGAEKVGHWLVLKAAYHGGDNSPYSKSYPVQGFAENLIQDLNDLFSESCPDITVIGGQGIFLDLSGGTIPYLSSVPGMRLVSRSIMRKKRRSIVPTVGFFIITITFSENGNYSVKMDAYPLPAVQNDYREKFSNNEIILRNLTEIQKKVLKLLEESPRTLGELSQTINKSDRTIGKIIDSLKQSGLDITSPDDIIDSAGNKNPFKNFKLNMNSRTGFWAQKIYWKNYFHTTVEEGAVSDTHIGSESELIPILTDAYKTFEGRKIKKVRHLGDITNGPPKHQEHYKGEVREFRATPLIEDVIDLYPLIKDIETEAILGDHDRWFLDLVGLNVLNHISKSRPDIKNLGVQKGESVNGQIITLLRHFNWGTGYSRSYKPQQASEGILKKVKKEEDILKAAERCYKGKIVVVLSGGGHVYCSMLYKGIVFILMPCLQGETNFITGLGEKLSDVGFIIYSITHDIGGILTRFGIEYFDRGAEALALMRKKAQKEKK